MKFLLTEGDGSARADLLALLENLGECLAVDNGSEAVAAHLQSLQGEGAYDLIFVDMKLEGPDWLSVVKAIRRAEERVRAAEVPIIMLVDRLSPREMIGAYYYGGCTDLLVKPVHLARLVRLLIANDLIEPERASHLLAQKISGRSDAGC